MMRIGLVLAAMLASGPVLAQGNAAATRRAQEEAQNYLRLCLMDEGEEKALCESNRAIFLRNYQAAKAGDYMGQRNVSALLSERGMPRLDYRIGVVENKLQSCAWALVLLYSGHARADDSDGRYAQARCGHRDVDRVAAEARAQVIMAEIRRSPAQMPPEPRVVRHRGPTITTSLPEDQ